MGNPYQKTIHRNLQTIKSVVNPKQVGYLILYLTNQCNFRCDFCFYYAEIEKGRKPNELQVDELRRIAENLGPLLQLSMTGGEPFLRSEIAEITSIFIENTCAKYITIPTNASFPQRIRKYLEEVLPKIPHTYFRIVFSIDGIGEVHDQRRSMPGSFEKIKKSYETISPLREKYRNLVLDSNSVYTSESEDTMLNTLKTLRELFNFDNMCVTYARGEVKDSKLKEVSHEKYKEINAYLENIERKKEKRLFYPFWRAAHSVSRDFLMDTVFDDKFVVPCVGGKKLMILSETGEVYPCEILGKSMGNIKDFDYDMKRLQAHHENQELVKWIKESKCKCSFECALAANVIWSPTAYPKLIKSAIHNIGKE